MHENPITGKLIAVEGLDGIYIGPNDLALALGAVPRSESDDPVVKEAVKHICERTKAHGKIAGIFCSSGEAAARRITEGFQIVTPGNEVALMSMAAKAAIAAARGVDDMSEDSIIWTPAAVLLTWKCPSPLSSTSDANPAMPLALADARISVAAFV